MSVSQKNLTVRLKNRQIKLEDFGNLITALPAKIRTKVERHVAEFLREAFETDEPAYNLQHRADAYGMQKGGPGWFSAKQRRFVMAKMKQEGRLVKTPTGWIVTPRNNRTGETGRSWVVVGRGPVTIKNTSQHAGWLFSDKYQARQPALVGWKKLSQLYEDNAEEAYEVASDFIVKEILKELE